LFAITAIARYVLPTLILQHDAYGCQLIVTILIFFAVTLKACYAVPMLILQDVAFAAG